MALLSIRDIRMSYGQTVVLDNVSLQIEPGERIALIGRNGEGKTTLMRIIDGDLEPLSGQIVRKPGLTMAMLDQKVPLDIEGTVFEQIVAGLGPRADLLREYHEVSRQLAQEDSRILLDKLDRLHHHIEAAGAWHVHQQVETVISHLKLNADTLVSTLSAGLKRRTLLGRALVLEPEILLLDEPTNHLDVDSIVWLEEFLQNYPGTLIFVTHDRMFLQKLSTRIVDIDRGQVRSWQCGYDEFVIRRQALLDAEARHNELFDKKLAQEEVWIRKGIQARRTRNEGRVRALMEMRQQRRRRRALAGKVKMEAHQAQDSGDMVVETLGLDFAYPGCDKKISHFTTTIMRGDKIGIIGPNGSGKTTLLKVLLGELRPTDGAIRMGTKLQISYFDQLHSQLDENKSVWENVADGYSTIKMNGRDKNVVGYLEDFLFTPQQARNRVANLSGGERNRLLLARLFAKPSNVLVLDEPTNDLDMETLELLEELLVDYTGTVLLVSHDRAFLNNVVTGTFVLQGDGKIRDYVGGYDDWLRQRGEPAADTETNGKKPSKEKTPPLKDGPKKRTYKEQKELDALPGRIEQLETALAALHEQMAQPAFYKQDPAAIAKASADLRQMENERAVAYARWEQLEGN